MYLRKVFLVFILFVSLGVSTIHHHNDGKPHFDCPVCIFQINNLSEDINNISFFSFCEKYPQGKPEKNITFRSYNPIKIHNQRAPPENS
ncbi:hypothetical protein [Persephonella sp.]